MFVDENSLKDINFANFDYCVDTLDTITTKILLIKTSKENNVPLISCMGTGNHFDPSSFKVMDLAKTSYDPVAKVLRRELKKYDIVVAALGKPHFLKGTDMKEGAIVIDAGIHYLESGIIGDVEPSDNLSLISKVPGGIGPITNACLMENVVSCYLMNR